MHERMLRPITTGRPRFTNCKPMRMAPLRLMAWRAEVSTFAFAITWGTWRRAAEQEAAT